MELLKSLFNKGKIAGTIYAAILAIQWGFRRYKNATASRICVAFNKCVEKRSTPVVDMRVHGAYSPPVFRSTINCNRQNYANNHRINSFKYIDRYSPSILERLRDPCYMYSLMNGKNCVA